MRKIFFVLTIVLILSGCKVATEVYEGTELKIAIVGEKPIIKEKNIDFSVFELQEIERNVKEISNNYDALFIMPEKFSEADDDIYVKTYEELTIPTFFIETTKLHLPFTIEGMTYESAPNLKGETAFVAGYLFSGTVDEYKDDAWKFYLKNNKKNDVNVQSVYTEIFKIIEGL